METVSGAPAVHPVQHSFYIEVSGETHVIKAETVKAAYRELLGRLPAGTRPTYLCSVDANKNFVYDFS